MLLLSYIYVMRARVRICPTHVRAAQVLNMAESVIKLLLQGLIALYVGDIHSESLLMVITCLADVPILQTQHTALSVLALCLQRE